MDVYLQITIGHENVNICRKYHNNTTSVEKVLR